MFSADYRRESTVSDFGSKYFRSQSGVVPSDSITFD
jgi:hypothetical protein